MANHTPGPWTIDTDGGIEDCEGHEWWQSLSDDDRKTVEAVLASLSGR